ncbi:glutathione S-transferase family protein [Maritalea sp.]|uniref:glutathione S-transferase family protein n=1 Tax=Maritalea sp. TaxID=2003361 RepID=UPI003EF27252
MGMLVDGLWTNEWYDTKSTGGHFKRKEANFRNFITKDGSAGPTGKAGFKAEADRYHLYISNACPWAHRTMIFRKLKQLEDLISVSVVDAKMPDEHGWTISKGEDPINNAKTMWQVYVAADKDYTGRVTVPVLWDKKLNTIVSNESSEIIRMFNTEFNDLTGNSDDYYPEQLRPQIDDINTRIYSDINNGVYKSGFATTQEAYDGAVTALFNSLDWVDDILANNKYLTGDTLTEADWRLFTTLVRFDPVYVGHFKCNIKRIADYPNITRLVDELTNVEGVRDTINMDDIRTHYYWSHTSINPHRIVPAGPAV